MDERHDGDDGRDGQTRVELRTEDGEHRIVPGERHADPRRLSNAREVHDARGGRHDVRPHHAQQDGDDLDHALAPDVRDDDDGDGHERDGPVRRRVRDGRAGQDEADGDHDGAGDHGREEAHDARGPEHLEQRRQHEVQQTRARHAQAGVRQQVGLAVRRDGRVARDERERRAEERGHLALRDEVEQQRAHAREQQRRGNGQAGQRRHQDGGAEHGEQVLEAQHQHLGQAKRPGVIDGLASGGGFVTHTCLLSRLGIGQKKSNCFFNEKAIALEKWNGDTQVKPKKHPVLHVPFLLPPPNFTL